MAISSFHEAHGNCRLLVKRLGRFAFVNFSSPDPRDMFLLLQIGFSFGKAAVACAILERTFGLEPSFATTVLRYSKLYGPIFCPFTLISLRMPLAQFVISLVFSALISILYLCRYFQLGFLIPALPQPKHLCHRLTPDW